MLYPAAITVAQVPPPRHLVYNFTLGMQNDTHDSASAVKQVNDPGFSSGDFETIHGTGDTPFKGIASDTGTITVDSFEVRSDGGLRVRVSETGRNYRSAAPVECVVYPTTRVACAGAILPEEAVVLSTLSPTFFNPAVLDVKNHWHGGNDVPGLSLDFTAGQPKGSVVSIAEDQNQRVAGGMGGVVHGTATFTYDTVKRVSTHLEAYDTIRQEGQPGQYSNVIVDITATLTSDTGQTAKN